MSIVITGNPGVGKHSIAEKISKDIGLGTTDINLVARKLDLIETGVESGDVDVSKLYTAFKECPKRSGLIVGHLAPYVLSSEQVKIVIVLRRNPYDLLVTYKDRGYSDEKSTENAASEILGIVFHDAKKAFGDMVFQVNVSGADDPIKNTTDIIHGTGRDSDVDWLSMVADNHDLGRFFSY